jgi:hypothetical protein
MRALVILAGKPGAVYCVEVVEVKVLAFQFDANLGPPRSVPALDRSLCLRISRLSEEELNTKVGADRAERVALVRGTSVYVVGPWTTVDLQWA